MKIVVINGEGGSGKDTFVRIYQQIYGNTANMSMIDAVKTVARSFDWHDEKDAKARKFLSDLKDAWEEYNDGPYKTMQWRIKLRQDMENFKNKNDDNLTIFIHAREPHDIKRFVEDYNAFTILIKRPETDGQFLNHADANVNNWDYDLVYENIGDYETFTRDIREIANYIDGLKFNSNPKED